ncbi:flagellar rod assembly protein/muramidase FlgJ [Marinobacterium nitratireducens]|uniref:Peptidoglycan hydrolase FlgJ n=1 Tax=Marinobacterium nitratireducens TaxID=518897 RepID=A0A918DW35_9GAMM|nr:flagellar assembly peptidoglycan hydrolase FlgJ [Marinobacterium nitratireducens]GGO84917.1 flagellar rod assembly protein/muramidase FlgJ [Marinobacterium nitratireducens]
MENNRLPGAKAALYTDLNQLSEIKRTSKDDSPEALKQVAKQFEQMFMSMMLKSMREANAGFAEDSPFNSSNVQFYQGMLDQQMTLELAQGKGMGLAEVLVKQLGQQLDIAGKPEDRRDLKPLGESDRMLRRAFDGGAGLGSRSRIGQAAMAKPAEPADAGQAAELPPHVSAPTADAGARVEPERFESPAHFVAELLPHAERLAPQIGVDPKVLLAQAALETGWGRHIVGDGAGNSSRNLFNIKADSRWQGERVGVTTLEYRDGLAVREPAAFRSYGSYADSFEDYVRFLKQNPRYSQALERAADPGAYLQELQAAGYATDPAYARKIEQIFAGEQLSGALKDGT